MELRDYTKALVTTKELATSTDRVMQTALRTAPAVVRKTGVPGIGTDDLPIIDPSVRPLVNSIQRQSPPSRLIALGAPEVPVSTRIPAAVIDPEPAWFAEGAPLPLARMSAEAVYTSPHAYAVMIALQKEWLRIGDPRSQSYVMKRVTAPMVGGDGTVFLGATAASTASPAGLLFNRQAVGSGSPSDLQDDLEQVYASVTDGEPALPVFILSGRAALYLNGTGLQAFRNLSLVGGTIAGAPAIIVPAAGANVVLVDASQIAISDGGIEIFQSENAAIQMDDSPTLGATSLVSAFQTNMVCLKLIRYLSWVLLREDAVAHLTLTIGGSPN